MYFLVSHRIFMLLKGVVRKPVLLRVSRQLNTSDKIARLIVTSFHAVD